MYKVCNDSNVKKKMSSLSKVCTNLFYRVHFQIKRTLSNHEVKTNKLIMLAVLAVHETCFIMTNTII